jgi:hypothetical protein
MPAVGSQNRLNVVLKPKKTVMVNQSGVIAVRKLSDLTDVDISAKEDGSLLIYDEETGKFKASTLLDKQDINGGQF